MKQSKIVGRCFVACLSLLMMGPLCFGQEPGPYTPLQKPPYLPPSVPTGYTTTKNWADLVSGGLEYLNDVGLKNKITSKLEELRPRIIKDLPFSSGGVLVVARLEAIRNDAGTFRTLMSDRLDYVGIGASPAEAQLSKIIRGNDDPFDVVAPGKQLDFENSVAYWFRRDKDGELVGGEQSLASLRQETLSLYADRELKKFDWQVARNGEIERLIKVYNEANIQAAAGQQLNDLWESRKQSLEALKELNRKLQDELEKAAKAEENAKVLQLLYMGAQFADFTAKASEGLSPSDQQAIKGQNTREGVFSELDRINKESLSKGKTLREDILVKSNVSNGIETQIITILRQNAVPTENLPPIQPNIPPPR